MKSQKNMRSVDDRPEAIKSILEHGDTSPVKISDYLDNNPVAISMAKRTSVYYSLTESEIEIYAQLNWLSTIILTIFGSLVGFSLGCVTALLQGNLTIEASSVLKSLAITVGLISLVFLAISIYLLAAQSKNKKTWKSSS